MLYTFFCRLVGSGDTRDSKATLPPLPGASACDAQLCVALHGERETPDPDQKLCWQAMNPGYQGKRLIEGSYLDYLVDDVLSSDFKFKPKPSL